MLLVHDHPVGLLHDHSVGESLVAGLLHPITGPGHVLAMLALGFVLARLPRPLLWAVPTAVGSLALHGAIAGAAYGAGFLGSTLALLGVGVAMGAVARYRGNAMRSMAATSAGCSDRPSAAIESNA